MRRDGKYSLLLAIGMLLVGAGVSPAQSPNTGATPQHPIDTRPEGQGTTCTYSASRSKGAVTGSSTCPIPDASAASAAKRFPYPGETPEITPSSQQVPITPSPSTDSQTPAQSTAKRFPYPGEPANSTTPNGPLKDAGSSGESTSSSNASSSSDSNLPPDDAAGSNNPDALPAPKRARKKLPPVARQTPDEQEEEDVKVAGFYQNDGNYRAAYMRAKDAVSITGDDPDAQFALAEAARKLGKFDEAQKSYKRCLDLDPVPKLRKASEKALKEMAGS